MDEALGNEEKLLLQPEREPREQRLDMDPLLEQQLQQQQPKRYYIHDYTAPGDAVTMDFAQWQHDTRKLTEGATIVEWHSYRSPLKTLAFMGKLVMQLFSFSPFLASACLFGSLATVIFITNNLSTSFTIYALIVLGLSLLCDLLYRYFHLKFQHSFLVFKLLGGVEGFVSLEKIKDGFLFQFARSLDTVKNNQRGHDRGYIEEMDFFSLELSFDAFLSRIPPSIGLIFNSEEIFDAYYSTFTNNCQQTVSMLLTELAKNSFRLKFQIPGSKDKVAIDSDKAVTFVEKLFPRWVEGEVQGFPEIQNPFAFPLKESPKSGTPGYNEYVSLILKQRVVKILSSLLGQERFGNFQGRKAIFSKLDKDSLAYTLKKVNFNEEASGPVLIEEISKMWKRTLDIVVVIEDLGVVLFHFFIASQTEDNISVVQQKMDLISKVEEAFLSSTSREKGGLIHAITISSSQRGITEYGSPTKSNHGHRLNVQICDQASNLELENCLATCLKLLTTAAGQASRSRRFWSALVSFLTTATVPDFSLFFRDDEKRENFPSPSPLHKFAAKLFLLQNMENKDFLIHERLTKQEFGEREFVIWTPTQNDLISKARNILNQQTKIQWIVQGCYGSGKTLVLMQLVKEFLDSRDTGNVFVHVPSANQRLSDMLSNHVSTKGWQGRVIVSSSPKIVEDVQLVLWDEFFFYVGGVRSSQKSIFCKFEDETPSVILFTSQSMEVINQCKSAYIEHVDWIDDLETQSLGGNLRSSMEISEFVAEFQQHLEDDDWAAGEPVKSALEWKSNHPEIVLFQDDSNERTKFARECIRRVKDFAAKERLVMICPFTHASLRAALEESCQDDATIEFGDTKDVLGCEYQCMVIILDAAMCDSSMRRLVDSMTRATTSLHLFINVSMKPIIIDEIPAYRREFCLKNDAESRMRHFLIQVEKYEKKTLIYDPHDLLPQDFYDEIEAKATKIRSFKTWSEFRDLTKEFSLVVDVRPNAQFGANASLSFALFVELVLCDEEEELARDERRRNLETQRTKVVQYFETISKRINSAQ